jgi:hypothetical protein
MGGEGHRKTPVLGVGQGEVKDLALVGGIAHHTGTVVTGESRGIGAGEEGGVFGEGELWHGGLLKK